MEEDGGTCVRLAMMMLLLPSLLLRGRCVVGGSDEAVLDNDGDDDDWRWRWRRIQFDGGVYFPRKAILYCCLDRGVAALAEPLLLCCSLLAVAVSGCIVSLIVVVSMPLSEGA